MIKNFTSEVTWPLLPSRSTALISLLNSTAVAGKAKMVIVTTIPVPTSQDILGIVQLSVTNKEEVKFPIVASSRSHLRNFISQFNMASANSCGIEFELVEPSTLKLTILPSSETVAEMVDNFFKLTSD